MRTAPTRAVFFILLATSAAFCQKTPSAESLLELRFDGLNSRDAQATVAPAQDTVAGAQESLPEAPSSVQPPAQTARTGIFVNGRTSPLMDGSLPAGWARDTASEHGTVGLQPTLAGTGHYQAAFIQKEPDNSVGRNAYPSLLGQDLRYLPSTSSSLMGRATYAASRILFTRDNSGKGKLNTSYFLGLLSSVASATAHRPYWARSSSETFNNFGSTIGGDAGASVLHEFGPGIRQMVKGLTPKFVSRIKERIIQQQTSPGIVHILAR